jgi:hypothetical protein
MNGLTAATGLDEHGNRVPTGGDSGGLQEHDILTGSQVDGRAFPAVPDNTCAGWTSSQAGPPRPPADAGDAAASDATSEGPSLDASQPDGAGLPDVASGEAGDAATAVPVAFVGHVNRTGTNAAPANASWNSSHATRGCSQADLMGVGGAGRIYCFAVRPGGD